MRDSHVNLSQGVLKVTREQLTARSLTDAEATWHGRSSQADCVKLCFKVPTLQNWFMTDLQLLLCLDGKPLSSKKTSSKCKPPHEFVIGLRLDLNWLDFCSHVSLSMDHALLSLSVLTP